MDKMDGMSMDIEQAERDKLQALFPQCFVKGRLDIDKLLNLCGEYIDNDFEKYKFEWSGKAACYRIAGKRSTGTLRPCREESVNWDATQNLYIEGDNLEVLKLLQTAYYRKVKMIYIDPPYNTGNDFVYEDDFRDPISRYKEVTGQTTKSNPETMGRYHTNWLNMMFPRLRLAANLLRDDGVIFISIDDGEQANLKKICDEVFGEENFVANAIWEKSDSPRMDAKLFSTKHDHTFIYAKSIESLQINRLSVNQIADHYNKTDEDGRKYYLKPLRSMGQNDSREARPKLFYALISPDDTEVFPVRSDGSDGNWRWSRDKVEKDIDRIAWVNGKSGWVPYYKIFADEQTERPPETIWYNKDVGSNRTSMAQIKEIFGDAKYFDTPKPIGLIKRMLQIGTDKDSIILDFFSGSATTAHAVMQLNAEDGGNRRFICVQLPEVCDEKSEAFKAGYQNICEIGKERIRRAGTRLQNEMQNGQTHLDDHSTLHSSHSTLDTGFRVLKLDSSNLMAWDATPIQDGDLQTLWDRFDALANTIKAGRDHMDIVFEVMLKMGVPLDYPVQPITVNDKTVYSIGEDALLLVCLDTGVTPEDVEAMCDLAPAKIIAAEEGFADDTALSNAHYILKDRDIEMKLL